MHSNGVKEDKSKKERDLSGKNVLISKNFVYYGKKAIELPPQFNNLIVGRGHKNNFPADFVTDFAKYASRYKTGLRASPTRWSVDDKSWQQGKAC